MVKLYIKTHNTTGIKYFGRTNKEDSHKYRGSGTHWKRHIEKHGYDVSTIILKEFEDGDLTIKSYATEFSKIYDVVKSPKWANMIIEDGCHSSGFLSGVDHPLYGKIGDECHNFGRKHSDDVNKSKGRSGILNGNYGVECTEEKKQRIRDGQPSMSGKNNGNYGNFGPHSPHKGSAIVELYDSDDVLVTTFRGRLKENCDEFGIPIHLISKGYLDGKRFYEDARPSDLTKIKKSGLIRFLGWRAKKVGTIT